MPGLLFWGRDSSRSGPQTKVGRKREASVGVAQLCNMVALRGLQSLFPSPTQNPCGKFAGPLCSDHLAEEHPFCLLSGLSKRRGAG